MWTYKNWVLGITIFSTFISGCGIRMNGKLTSTAGTLSPIASSSGATALSSSFTSFNQVVSGQYHSCGLSTDSQVYCWGRDDSGQLGHGGASASKNIPTLIDTSNLTAGTVFTQLTSGDSHTCGLANDGKAYCWGYDGWGQLGNGGGNTDVSVPTAVSTVNLVAGTSFIEIAAGGYHTCGITNDYKAYCWGADNFGQMGNGAAATQTVPTLVDTSALVAGSSFVHITAGLYYTCALASDGKAYCWGDDSNGALGDDLVSANKNIPTLVSTVNLTPGSSFVSIHASNSEHTCGLASDGKAYCWGSDSFGQLGDGAVLANKMIPTAVDVSGLAAGTLFKKLMTGSWHTCGITNDSKTYCWGSDIFGQIGDGNSNTDQPTPALVDLSGLQTGTTLTELGLGGAHSCAISNNKRVYCWGWNGHGQIGDASSTDRSAPVALATDTIALSTQQLVDIAVSRGDTIRNTYVNGRSCGISNLGKVYCWGDDAHGALGNGGADTNTSTPTEVDTSNLAAGTAFVKVGVGFYHTCGLTTDGKVYCWGADLVGQLGDGAALVDKAIPTLVDMSNLVAGTSFVQLAVGGFFNCAIASDGKTYCWGGGGSGAVGIGDGSFADVTVPTLIDQSNLVAGTQFVKVAAGGYSVCGLTNDGKVYCWGLDNYGQLGNGGANVNLDKPTLISSVNVTAGASFLDLAPGGVHNCANASDGKSYCWGYNDYGQLGNAAWVTQNVPVAMDFSSLNAGASIVKIDAGFIHSCGISSDGLSYCWGADFNGRLGDVGANLEKNIPTLITLTNLPANAGFLSISAGTDHSCAIASDTKTYCWGYDGVGQLGDDAALVDQNIPVAVDLSSL